MGFVACSQETGISNDICAVNTYDKYSVFTESPFKSNITLRFRPNIGNR